MEDVCDVCGNVYKDSELYAVEYWIENNIKIKITKTYMAPAFSWACRKCLMTLRRQGDGGKFN